MLTLAPIISYPHAVVFDVVVVVVVVTLGVSLPALLLRFLYYIQVGGKCVSQTDGFLLDNSK